MGVCKSVRIGASSSVWVDEYLFLVPAGANYADLVAKYLNEKGETQNKPA